MAVKVHTCVGGTDVKEDIKILKQGGFHVVIGTAGRLNDMIKREFLKTAHLKMLVVDESI